MVILYSTGCPKCKVLETKLIQNNIDYIKCDNTEIMKEKNISSVPVLEVNNVLINFRDAAEKINRGEIK